MLHPFSFFSSTNIVINFHRIPSTLWFEKIINRISKIYNFVSARDIEEYFYSEKYFNNCCHICFDDGDKTVFENAFPVLKKFNIPATVFVSPKIIEEKIYYWFQELALVQNKVSHDDVKKIIAEKTIFDSNKLNKYSTINIFKSLPISKISEILSTIKKEHNIVYTDYPNITKRQLKELLDSNLITFGAHTLTHPILKNEPEQVALVEIKKGISDLKKMIQREIHYFAYPNGRLNLDFSDREEKILRQENIKIAFTTEAGFFNKKIHPLRVPRIGFVERKKENSIWIYIKIMLAPIWKYFEAKKEIKERLEI